MACSGCAARREWIKKWSKVAYERSIDLVTGKTGGSPREHSSVDASDRRQVGPTDPGDGR